MKSKYFYTLVLLIIAQLSSAQSEEIHSARISITSKATLNSSTTYQRLLGEEAKAFDLGDYLRKHGNLADIKIRGTIVRDTEVVRVSFNKEDWDGECYSFCEKTTEVKKLPLMGVATIPAVDIPGVEVQRTIDGSAAAATGILPGDIITNIEGETVYSGCDLHTTINAYEAGDALDVDIVRNGRAELLSVVLGYKIQKNTVWTACCEGAAATELPAIIATDDLLPGELEVFPNPTTGIAQVKYSSEMEGSFSLRLTDVAGRVIYKNSEEKFNGYFDEAIDMTGRAVGIYFLQIVHGGESRTEKVILQSAK